MSDLTDITLKDALEGLKARRFSSAEITQAHLTAMRVAGQNQVVAPSVEAIGLDRVVDEEHPSPGFRRVEGMHPAQAHPDELEIVLRQEEAAILQPCAAGGQQADYNGQGAHQRQARRLLVEVRTFVLAA